MVYTLVKFCFFCFFFQAEDGIRDTSVTGVQTCALPISDRGTIFAPTGRHPSDRKRQTIVPPLKGGRYAVTHWQVAERLNNFTLMRFRLETGRTHQIRVHCAHVGHPIVGDPTYGSGRSVGVNLPGQALHAEQLTLVHPVSGEPVTAIAPLPPHFLKLLAVLHNRTV